LKHHQDCAWSYKLYASLLGMCIIGRSWFSHPECHQVNLYSYLLQEPFTYKICVVTKLCYINLIIVGSEIVPRASEWLLRKRTCYHNFWSIISLLQLVWFLTNGIIYYTWFLTNGIVYYTYCWIGNYWQLEVCVCVFLEY